MATIGSTTEILERVKVREVAGVFSLARRAADDPNSYYRERELVPPDMLGDIGEAKIVITNYHAFRRREDMDVSKVGRALLKGRGPEPDTIETEGKMLQRACGDLMGLKNIVVLNDEAHHCYREKPQAEDGEKLKGEDKEEAKKNNEAGAAVDLRHRDGEEKARTGSCLRLVGDAVFPARLGVRRGHTFPWPVSDFSLMDAIESGIVKLPRLPIADNIPGGDMPRFRELWKHIRPKMPKKGRGKAGELDPVSLPTELQTALEALYGHYAKTPQEWEAGIEVPPVFHWERGSGCAVRQASCRHRAASTSRAAPPAAAPRRPAAWP